MKPHRTLNMQKSYISKTSNSAVFSFGRGGRNRSGLLKSVCVKNAYFCKPITPRLAASTSQLAPRLRPFDSFLTKFNTWQGWKESNPPLEFWRLSFYR